MKYFPSMIVMHLDSLMKHKQVNLFLISLKLLTKIGLSHKEKLVKYSEPLIKMEMEKFKNMKLKKYWQIYLHAD